MPHRTILDPVLTRLGAEPYRFWLLTDLFNELSARRELWGSLGRSGMTLKILAGIYAFMMGIITLAGVAASPPIGTYVGTYLTIGGFVLIAILLSETSTSLVNIEEGTLLAHQPINGATYTLAKLAHLVQVLGWMVPAVNGLPALGLLFLVETHWYSPIVYLAAALLLGVFVALSVCGLFGILLRFVAPARVKAVAQTAEMMPMLILGILNATSRRGARGLHLPAWIPSPVTLSIAAAGILTVLTIAGLRALSADYLSRIAAVSQGHGSKRKSGRRSILGAVVSHWFGGPAARAGQEFVAKLLRRDVQPRRAMMGIIPSLGIFLAAVVRSFPAGPFVKQGFSPLHGVPHIVGLFLFMLCGTLVHGSDYKASWVFRHASDIAMQGFARGVHAALWLAAVVIPHLILLAVASAFWPFRDALLFTTYSFMVASVHLAVEINLIGSVPFSQQPKAGRQAMTLAYMFFGGIASAILMALQYFFLFKSTGILLAATAVFAALAGLLTAASINAFALRMIFHIQTETGEASVLYHEVE